MWKKYRIMIALVAVALLVGGGIVSYDLYACGACGCGGGCGGGQHKAGQQNPKEEVQDKAKDETQAVVTGNDASPAQMLKQADVLQAQLGKAKNDKAQKEKCQKEIMLLSYQIVQSAQEMVAKCGEMLKDESPNIKKITELTNQANDLLKKSLEMIPQGCIMMSADKKNTASKDQYICPMGCVAPTDKPGRCPKCGMNLKKNK